jgi:2-phospho-L-lactate guanylyltransferase
VRTAAILPVKRLVNAKQRLGASVADSTRLELARAMVGDVLIALRETPSIDETILVTNDEQIRRAARYLGVSVLADSAEAGQSQAVRTGLEHALNGRAQRALCVPGDCPALDPGELERLLGSDDGEQPSVVVMPDRHGSGTNGLLLTPPDVITPSFGPDSRVRHEQLARAAKVDLRVELLPSLLLDVDTGEDLATLRERLAGEGVVAHRTRAVLGVAKGSGRT